MECVADRDAYAARVLLTSVYWSELDDLLEPDERRLDYIRVSVSGGRGFCYLTDRNLWWTREQPGGESTTRGCVPLAGIEAVEWVDSGRFALTESRFGTTYRSEFGTAAGQPRRHITRFVWNLSAARGPVGSGTPSPLPMAYRRPHVAHPPQPGRGLSTVDPDPAWWQTG